MVRAPTTLKAKALQLLAARDYSRAELEQRLQLWLRRRALLEQTRAATGGERDGAESEARPVRRHASWAAEHAGPDADHSTPPNAHIDRSAHGPVVSAETDADGDHHATSGRGTDGSHTIAALLDELAHKGYLSDARAAHSLVQRRAARLGNARVLHELRRAGVADELVAAAAEELAGTELDRARGVWARKFGSAPATPAERARQQRFLASRGFGADVVRQVLRGADQDGE